MEATTLSVGNAILRRLLQAEWELLDAALTEAYRQQQIERRLVHRLEGFGYTVKLEPAA